MKITRVLIKNYKSIKEIDFQPNKGLNAFIGANSVGKSNVFDAINWLLRPTYPSFNSIQKEDHFLGKETNKIVIRLEFDDSHSLEMNEHKELTNPRGELEVKSGLFYDTQTWNCKGEIREKYASAYLGVDRQILEYLPSNRWSLIGRILQDVNKRFLTEELEYKGQTKQKKVWLKEWLSVVRDRLLFSVKDEAGEEIMSKFINIIQEESARQLNIPASDFELDLSLYDPWNFYKTLQLLVKESDMGLEFQAANLGMGVQASISIAILKAYSEINLANMTPIFIDEPELFLHPQAQQNFYRILRDLAEDKVNVTDGEILREGTQVFYTTHSPNFLSAGYFDEIFLVRKTKTQGTYLKFGFPEHFVKDLKERKGKETTSAELMLSYKNAFENTGDTQKANEGFFAKKVILVEGQSESLVMPYLFDLTDFDYIREGVSIVRCGNKSEIGRFYRLYSEFGIPCYIIFDGDKHLEEKLDEPGIKVNIKKNKEILELFGDTSLDYPEQEPKDSYFGFTECFEKNLGFDTNKKGLSLYIEVKEQIKTAEDVPLWIGEVKKKIELLDEQDVESVLKT